MELKRLSEHTWYLPFEEKRDRPNLCYIHGEKLNLAVDAGHSEDHTKEFYKALEEAGLPLPDITVITHWHWDHTLGMHAVHGLTLANEKTRQHIADFKHKIETEGTEGFLAFDECIREAQAAADNADAELARLVRTFDLNDSQIEEQRRRLSSEARGKADAAKARGLDAIAQKIAEIDAEEQKTAQTRSLDSAYLSRLETKLRLAESLRTGVNPMGTAVDNTDAMRAIRGDLRTMFSEFSGDPLAASIIRQRLSKEQAAIVMPENSVGVRQEHLKNTVARLFEKGIRLADVDANEGGKRNVDRAAEVECFRMYNAQQTDDFSRPDRDVWAETRTMREEAGISTGLSFDMALMSVSGMK